jgi:D-alanine-D-alanine ligase
MKRREKKIRVGILFGGKSAEHEVSILSAQSVLEALDKEKFSVVLIGIDKQGKWHLNNEPERLSSGVSAKTAKLDAHGRELTLQPGNAKRELISATTHEPIESLDVVFPIMHGPLAEDGTIQGFLELANVPYVGAGVLGSAVGMDKDVMKRLLRDAGIPITKFLTVTQANRDSLEASDVQEQLGWPVFVKPANMGSSVGVSKAGTPDELDAAIAQAFKFDTKVLIEKAVDGEEVECAVLGNDQPKASLPGRILPSDDFYTYNAKYTDESGTILEIPADLPKDVVARVQEMAVKVFMVLNCEGLARVDMFVTKSSEVVVNEINTLPGFTRLSMYPRLWEVSGLPYRELVTTLLELALERYNRRQRLQTSLD